MRRYELVTVVTDGHRIEGRRGLVLAFFGKILAFFGNKRAILQLFTGVTDGHSGHRWSQMVTGGHSWSQNRRGLGAPADTTPQHTSNTNRHLVSTPPSSELLERVGSVSTPLQHHTSTTSTRLRVTLGAAHQTSELLEWCRGSVGLGWSGAGVVLFQH